MPNLWTNSFLNSPAHERELTASSTNRLMLAVLEEALVTFQRGLNSRSPEQRHQCCEVDRWIASRDRHFLFSFESICSCLKIDPGYVRQGLKRLRVAARQGQYVYKPYALRRERMYDRRAWRGHIR
jgi:hypothetical protein